MGIYYNPPPPNIGRQQPLDPPKVEPPISGPTPQAPPINGGAQVPEAVLVDWIDNPQPQQRRVFAPQQQAVVATYVPPAISTNVVLQGWLAPPTFFYEPASVTPPRANLDVFNGADWPSGLLPWFEQEAPRQPQISSTIDPPRPNLDVFNGAEWPNGLINWFEQEPPRQPQVASTISPPRPNLDVFNGAEWPNGLINWFEQEAPRQPQVSSTLDPPQSSLDVYRAPTAPLAAISWAPPDPRPQQPAQQNILLQNEPVSTSPELLAIYDAWLTLQQQPQSVVPSPQQAIVASVFVPAKGLPIQWPTPDYVLQARAPAPQPIVNNPPINGGASIPEAVLVDWLPLPPDPFFGWNGPLLRIPQQYPPPIAPSQPPVIGAFVPAAVLIAHIPPPPSPFMGWNGPLLIEPAPQPIVNNPPLGATRPNQAILGAWLLPAPQPPTLAFLTASGQNVVSFVPPGNNILSVLASWAAIAQQPAFAELLAPPPELDVYSGVSRAPLALLSYVDQPTLLVPNKLIQGAAASLVLPATSLLSVFDAWLLPDPRPQQGPFFGQGTPPIPYRGIPVSTPLAVLLDWLPPQPLPTLNELATPPNTPPPIPLGIFPRAITPQLLWWQQAPPMPLLNPSLFLNFPIPTPASVRVRIALTLGSITGKVTIVGRRNIVLKN